MQKKSNIKEWLIDILYAVLAGVIVGTAYHLFQNSNGFAPGGVGGLATIAYHFFGDKISWSVFMIAFNLPIFILVSIYVNRKLGLVLTVYILTQSFIPNLYEYLGVKAYCLQNSGADYNVVFACLFTGVVSGFGFSMMLRRFGASGGTYGISALIKKAKPETNVAYVAFVMDACVVAIAFFVYGMKITPAAATLMNLLVASVIVDNGLSGLKSGYKFEIVTDRPEELAEELMVKLKHGVTEINVHGMYSGSDKYMLVCIINKRQIGEMMKIIKSHPGTFASFQKVNEVFGNFRRKV